MIFNLIHRPCGHYKSYNFQRECAHDLNFKSTILIPTKQFENPDVIELAKEDNEKYGDEVGIWLDPMADMPDTQVWLLSKEDKIKMLEYKYGGNFLLHMRNKNIIQICKGQFSLIN